MCLAVPGKILSIEYKENSPKMAKVSFGGVIKDICIDFTPDVKVGEYVMVHVGFSLNIVNEKEAEETLKLLSELESEIDLEKRKLNEIH